MSVGCWRVRGWLGAYQDGELPEAARRRVERHVARCEACRQELGALRQLRVALAGEVDDPGPAVWDAFWPQVRMRLASAPPARPVSPWQRLREALALRPGLALAAPTAVAASLAILAVLAPWQRAPEPPALAPPATFDQVVIQSIETADPDVPVMVYASPESDLTVLWVFGLEPTGT